MRLNIDIKPAIYVSSYDRKSQYELFSNVMVGTGKFMSNCAYDNQFIYAYSCNKHNRKVTRTNQFYIKEFDNKKVRVRKSKIIQKHYDYVGYKIPIALLKLLNKRVIQHSKHFTIEDIL